MDVGNNCCMAKFFDVFLIAISIFFVTFCWIYYVIRDGTTALWLALIVGVCASYVVYRIVNNRHKKAQLSRNKKARLQSFSNYLCFCENIQNVVADLLKYYNFDVTSVQNDGIIAMKNSKKCFVTWLLDDDCVSVCNVRKVVKMAKRQNAERLIVFCVGAKGTEIALANGQLPTRFIDVQSAYALFEQADKLPQLTTSKVKKSAYFCQFAFSKKRFGAYLVSGIFLLITSALTFFPLYAIVWGTALIVAGIYSLFNKKYNVANTVVTLE